MQYYLCLKNIFDKMNGKVLPGISIQSSDRFFAKWENSHFKFLDRAFESHEFLKLVLFQMHLI